VKFILDMNLAPRWAEFLEQAGMEAVHWSQIGAGDATDVEIMNYSLANGYWVITHDLDFGAILAASQLDGPSVIQLRARDISPETIGHHLIGAVKKYQEDLQAGALLTIDPSRMRLSLLPLR
jgi:predicted nuclease of predicted toxin-antitoxin system